MFILKNTGSLPSLPSLDLHHFPFTNNVSTRRLGTTSVDQNPRIRDESQFLARSSRRLQKLLGFERISLNVEDGRARNVSNNEFIVYVFFLSFGKKKKVRIFFYSGK